MDDFLFMEEHIPGSNRFSHYHGNTRKVEECEDDGDEIGSRFLYELDVLHYRQRLHSSYIEVVQIPCFNATLLLICCIASIFAVLFALDSSTFVVESGESLGLTEELSSFTFGFLVDKGLTTTTVAPPAFVGLGGIDVNTSSQPKQGDQTQANVKVKETLVPDEIAKTVEDLKAYIKQQKTLSSDIGRASLSKLYSVTNDIQTINIALQEVTNSVEQTYSQTKSLRRETSKAIQSAEIAQRTNDTPSGLQFENTAPFFYFVSLVEKYEQDLIVYRNQITAIENHMKSIMNPQGINPTELKNGLQHINECFISLAGRLHEIHQKVETQKEQFLNLRKYRLRDCENNKLQSKTAADNINGFPNFTPNHIEKESQIQELLLSLTP
uniref:Uncharacterized protein n=1 Tax=Megaselia scalaris TaxID=36166 RepID=T1GM20_MEGSC